MGRPHTMARDTADARYDFILRGEVVDNADPENLGRVRVLVPGLLEPESSWAWPIGRMYGVQNGLWWVPEVGSPVFVFLDQGDVDHPLYMPGWWGKPGGTSDVPEEAANSVDNMVLRWRQFHLRFRGESGNESLTLEDLGSGTKLEFTRDSGDALREVSGSDTVTVQEDKTTTVVTGDLTTTVTAGDEIRTISAGDRTTTIGGNDTTTLTGDEILTATGSSTETLGTAKTITAPTITLTGAAGVNIVSAAAVTLAAPSISQTSTGPSTAVSAGLKTETFSGGIIATTIGAVSRSITGTFNRTVSGVASWVLEDAANWTISGAATWTLNGVAAFLGATINLGLGPTYRRLIDERFSILFDAHTHSGPGTTPTIPITPLLIAFTTNHTRAT